MTLELEILFKFKENENVNHIVCRIVEDNFFWEFMIQDEFLKVLFAYRKEQENLCKNNGIFYASKDTKFKFKFKDFCKFKSENMKVKYLI